MYSLYVTNVRVTQTGEWVPSQTNFTSLASPTAVGSGNTALVTLMHEGGHGEWTAITRLLCNLISLLHCHLSFFLTYLLLPSLSRPLCQRDSTQSAVFSRASANKCGLC